MVTRRRGNVFFALVCALALLAGPLAAVAQQRAAARRDSVVQLARQQVGRRYLFGGTDPDRGLDCSGFLQYVMRAFNVRLPRTSREQARAGQEVPREPGRLLPGDILTFGRNGRVSHVGMYIGGGRYIHASSRAGRIVEAQLDRPGSRVMRAWIGVRRFFVDDDSTRTVASTQPPAGGS